MQISDLPDLAHSRPQPIHWLATATVMAAVVALGGVLQPKAAASQDAARSTLAVHHAPAPDPAGMTFPMNCAGAGTVVAKKVSGDLDGDGNPETVAVVRCRAGSGTPPSGVYVLTQAGAATPRIVATLVDPKERLSVGAGLRIRDGAVEATLLGYSGPNVPSCCPDVTNRVYWQWRSGSFVRGNLPEGRSV